jgi:hypothetical protein
MWGGLICDPIAAQSLSGLILGRRVAQALLPAALTLPSAQASEARPGRAERGGTYVSSDRPRPVAPLRPALHLG